VHPNPVAGFSISGNNASGDGATIIFNDQSLGASSWIWDFGTGDVSSSQNPEYTYNDEGEYTVWQYVENQWGCTDSTFNTVIVKPSVTFYIPNAFSPNGDGINDVFHPFGINVDTDNYQMLIYDRWGKQVFRTDNINTPWDGTSYESAGKTLPTGVYVYKISVSIEGSQKVFDGIVTLVF
jgi:gliding motility-associated-like protein